jgi:signal transduction histidine kinase/ActR/RegA family two-component response regulator
MMFGRRQNGSEATVRGLLHAASPRNARRQLIQETVQFLIGNAKADRIGLWMDGAETGDSPGSLRARFNGVVADRDGRVTPSEWERLSPEAPLPFELLNGGKTVELDLNGAPDQAILGALVEIRRAVWVPLAIRGRLRGVLLAGSRKRHGLLPVRLLESVSAELSLAMELDEQRRLAQQRQADLEVTKGFLDELAQSGPTDTILARLVQGCTNAGPEGEGLGAVFAELRPRHAGEFVIHGHRDEHADTTESPGYLGWQGADGRTSCLQSGDPAWLHALKSPPLADIWERARTTHGTVSMRAGSGTAWPRGDVERLVAIGLEAGGETIGVLAAGFRHEATSQEATQRLEVRAGLMMAALLLRERSNESTERAAHLRALLQANSLATILVERGGTIVGLSSGARELLGEPEQESKELRVPDGDVRGNQTPRLEFPDLFRAHEQARVETWLHRVQTPAHGAIGIDDDPPEVELQIGGRVRLRCNQPGGGLVAVLLEPLPTMPDTSLQHRRAESQLFHVMEWLDEGVVLFDDQHGIRAMNSRFAQIAGLAPEEIAGITTLHGLITRLADQAAEPEKFARRWRELARGVDSGMREEIQLARPVPRVWERTARPVLGPDGRRAGRVEIYRDLTAQRVFQSKLAQSEKLAALGQMVTGVAHELSNPLTSILGYAQRLFLRNQAEGQSDEVRQIFQEAERASAIVRQLLMSARESQPERRRVSLNQIVSRTIDLQKVSLATEKVTIELNLDAALPFILGDAGQLQQVLMNLVGNARQAIEQCGRGGTIRISTKIAGSGRCAQLEVSDNGPGIPQAIASRIFDPFFTTKPAGIGTGLGLAIVLGVVREHGGRVKVTASPGGGAIFCAEFPAEPASQQRMPAVPVLQRWSNHDLIKLRPSPVAAQPLAVGAMAGSPWRGARVLVVEDEPTVAGLISDVLEDQGFQVDALLDGHEALERAARESYDLVVCDMKMPGLDGQRFYETLASTGNPLRKRFLFVTGDVLSSHTHEFLERHQLPHVAKPFRVEELTEKVHRMLMEVRPSRALSAPAAGPSFRVRSSEGTT